LNVRPALPLLFAACLSSMPALADDTDKRMDEFRKAALAERKKLGLDKDAAKLKAAYPTPEVQFKGPGAQSCAVVCPGKTATVLLEGKLPLKSGVFVHSLDIEVVKEEVSAKGWEATLKAKPLAPPSRVSVDVLAPVSLAGQYVQGLTIGCGYTWVMDVEAGPTLTVKTDWSGCAENPSATGEWSLKGKALGTVKLRVVRGEGSDVSFEREQSPEEQTAQLNAMQAMMTSPEYKALDARQAALSKELEACGKLPPAKMGECFKKPGQAIEAMSKERAALLEKGQRSAAPAFGCDEVRVTAKDGALDGDAKGCVGKKNDERVKVTGRYTAM
jgi:hypothetical protein